MNSMGSIGGGCIDLNHAASTSFSADQRVEPKICENCSKTFFRSLLSMDKYCAHCKKRMAAAEVAKNAPIPPPDGPGEEAGYAAERAWLTRRANRALTMKATA